MHQIIWMRTRSVLALLLLSAGALAAPVDEKDAARTLQDYLARDGSDPARCAWLSRAYSGDWLVTAAGWEALQAIEAGAAGPCPSVAPMSMAPTVPAATPKPPPPALERASQDPPALFDGSARPMPPLSLEWGSLPSDYARARTLESSYHAYGWGTDRLQAKLFDRKDGAGARAARAGKALVLDVPIAWILALVQHEAGHAESALGDGVDHLSLEVTWENGAPLARVMMSPRDYERLSPAQKQAFKAAGLDATQAGWDGLAAQALSRDKIDWSYLAMGLLYKWDTTHYNLMMTPEPSPDDCLAVGPGLNKSVVAGTGKPGNCSYADEKDTAFYRDYLAVRTGRSREAIQRELVAGAVLNSLDPLALWSLYDYLYKYVWKGEEQADNPMPHLGPYQAALSTGYWLSEVGPQYRINAYLRDPKSGILLQVSPNATSDGQVSVETKLAGLPLLRRLAAELSGAVWDQRAHAEAGPRQLGGSIGGGLDLQLLKKLVLSGSGGYKTTGAELGRPFQAGPFGEGGLKYVE